MTVSANRAFFVKLGEADAWSKKCLSENTVRLGYYEAPHGMVLAGDGDSIAEIYKKTGSNQQTATSYANQILKFYKDDPETLWVTFLDGYLWWCKLSGAVEYLGSDPAQHPYGARRRHCNPDYPWSNEDINGEPLVMNNLRGGLTAVAGFQGTICNVHEFPYVLQKINGIVPPEVGAAIEAKGRLTPEIQKLIQTLTWQDFEILADLAFSRSGWRRIGRVGGTQKTVDIEMEIPFTGERAFVQVKSRTDQTQLNEYVEAFSRREDAFMFYVYHTATGPVSSDAPGVEVIGPGRLAEMVFDAGLFNWLVDKAE